MEIKINNNVFHLLPQKAIYWQEKNSLLISDLHLGKISHFRNEGFAIPQRALENNFTRLEKIMLEYNPEKIIFLGDLFHSHINDEWRNFSEWRTKYFKVEMHLVLGNHDRLAKHHYKNLSIHIHNKELHIDPFTFSHHPRKATSEDEYIFSGHIHPVFNLRGLGNQSLKFPCFYFTNAQALMPSFGYFTGGFEIQAEENSRVILIVNDSLKEVR